MLSALVAYGSSGEESSDEENTEEAVSKLSVVEKLSRGGLGLPAPKVVKSEPLPEVKRENVHTMNMFASLPAPKKEDSSVSYIEEDDDDIIPIAKNKSNKIKTEHPASVKQKVKITIPALADFKDDEDSAPRTKKPKLTPKGSGLLAILPEPKNMSLKSSRVMVPHVLTRKPAPKPVPRKKPAAASSSKALVSGYPDSDDSGDESVDHKTTISSGVDFFSLTSQVAPEPAIINLEELLPPTAGPSKPPPSHKPAVSQDVQMHYIPEPEEQQPQSHLQLDEEALRQLCGRRGARGEDMNIIELHGDNMLPDPKEWMLKQMTEEQEQQAHRSSQPSSAHKRKHQITYLAFQAKEREIELKNQWAQNRMTKKQTQAKYGF